MRGESFDAERFGRVMAAEKKIDSKFLRGDRSPMRRFAGDKDVDLVLGNAVNFSTGPAGDNADILRIFRTEIECFHRTAYCLSQFSNQIIPRTENFRSNSDELSFFFKEWLGRFQSKRRGELGVVADFRMKIQRQMRAIERDVVFEREFQLAA